MPLPTRLFAGVKVPDTPIVNKAIAYARHHLTDHGYNHVMRSWLVGQLMISRLPPQAQGSFDQEAFAIGTILHDLGWSKSPDLISKDKTFEVDGANSAREFLCKEGDPQVWDKHRIQLVWDLIALHTTAAIAAHKEIEVAVAFSAIFADLMGLGVAKSMMGEMMSLTEDEWDVIEEEFPREGLRGFIKETICGLCVSKPETTHWNFQSGFGERFVDGYKGEEMNIVDLMMECITE